MEAIKLLEQLAQPNLSRNTKDILGFDLGHGDTSVAFVPATKLERAQLEIAKGKKVIPTAVGKKAGGTVVVGDAAYLSDVLKVEHQFKSSRVTDPNVSEPIRAFVKKVFEELRRNNSTISYDKSTLVVFGCPSAWSAEQRLAYGKLLSQETSGMQFMLVPESRAAFITMKEAGHLSYSELRQPVLIIDLGSSTTDFTFTKDLEPKELPIGDKYPLGASLIEHQLLNVALNASSDRVAIEDWWKKDSSEYHRTVMAFRKAKEDYFSDEELYRNSFVPVTVTYYPGDMPITIAAKLTPSNFEAAIGYPISTLGDQAVSWRARYRADLIAAKQRIQGIIGGPPSFVILTGGAARMDFTEAIAKEVFSSPTVVKRAPEPEHAISAGLAFAGSIRYRTQEFHNEIKGIIDSTKVEDVIQKHMGSFAEAIAKVVADNATERFILPEFLAWRNSGKGKLKDVAERISARMKTWNESEAGRTQILRSLAGWYKKIETNLHEITAPICMKYNLAADVLDIPKAPFDPKQPKTSTNPDEVMFGTARVVLSAVIATISFVTGVILFGAGTAILLPTGPLAPIIAGLFLWIIGEAGKEWIMDQIMDSNVPAWLRKIYPESWLKSNVSDRAAVTEEEILTEVVRSIVGGYPDDDPEKVKKEKQAKQNQAEIVKKVTAGIESALRERAEEVSILIT